MDRFDLVSSMEPRGDQPEAIERLAERILRGERYSTLLGVTGSGKTFTMAHVIARVNRPTLVISHNKTLAAQLYAEFREFFPRNAVHYFVSYYDYYQPEAYIPQRDLYIEKDADINENIERLRLAATSALQSRRDVIIVASVSCIYGLGDPEDYRGMVLPLARGEPFDRRAALRALVDMQYQRAGVEFTRGHFRVRGEAVEVLPAYEEFGVRIELDPEERIARIVEFDPVSGVERFERDRYVVYPAKHFVLPDEKIRRALEAIGQELVERVEWFRARGRLLEAHRLEARTRYDMELLREVGYCKGIENYSRHLSGRPPGSRPWTLIDYFPKDFLCIVDESHVTIPQIRGMYHGDRSRKETLVEHGFRLPSALDNRPMTFEEWHEAVPQLLFVSATPGPWELERCRGEVVEQIIRPTGLVDPKIRVEPARTQVPHLLGEVRARVERRERVLVTILTKRLAEDLAKYFEEEGIRCRYLHSEIETIDRVAILRELREGKFDVLVGVNLLREGLDLPEVSLVAILDADKEGFLRSAVSIIQTVGRTARNVNGEVILYADEVTPAMRAAIEETERRRRIQIEYNERHGITPESVRKEIRRGIEEILEAHRIAASAAGLPEDDYRRREIASALEREMLAAAERLEFERAAELRDMIRMLRGDGSATTPPGGRRGRRRRAGRAQRR